MNRMVDGFVSHSQHCAYTHHGGGGGSPVSERHTIGCVGESWCSASACPGQRAGVLSLGSVNNDIDDDSATKHGDSHTRNSHRQSV